MQTAESTNSIENIENWRKAGKIAAEALAYGKGLIKKGSSLLEVSDLIEKKIISLGGKPAFPIQISCDHIAAHFCPDADDKTVFENQLASLDVGVHVNGCIGDTALTVDLSGKHSDLVKASEEALKAAIKVVQIGATLGSIGKEIKETIASFGFSPIRNLSGHGLAEYNIHDKPTIPNFDTGDRTELQKGQIIAIEPFATNGAGAVYEASPATLFSLVNKKPVRSSFARELLKELQEYNELPFTTRWLTSGAAKMPAGKVRLGLRELMNVNILRDYPPLVEQDKGLVSQAEHTLLVDDNVEVLTKSAD